MTKSSAIFKGSRAKILAKDGIGLELNQNLRLTDGTTNYDIQPNTNTGTLEVSLENSTFAQIGQSLMARIRNDGVVVTKAALVYSSNVSGHKIIVKPAIATSASQVAGVIGWTTSSLGTNVDGYAQISGVLSNVKTNTDSDGNALSVGDILYVSASVAGGYTKVAPTNKRLVGVVMEAHQTQGKILCQVNPPVSLEEIINVKITSLADLDMLRYDSTSQTWKNVSGIIPPSLGGTGIANNNAATTTRVGNYTKTETLTNNTSVTYPTSGTLATIGGAETLTNKTFDDGFLIVHETDVTTPASGRVAVFAKNDDNLYTKNASGVVQLVGQEVKVISGNVTLTKNCVHLVNTSAARSLTLPTPALNIWITVKDKTGSAQTNNITIVRAGSEKIETVAASYTMSTDLQSLTFVSDGTDWFVV